MKEVQIQILPVYSRIANSTDVPSHVAKQLPPGWQLSEHQIRTYNALLRGDTEVVFNTAMTGDGKSLAAYLPALIDGYHAFGMYPTIELSRDQERQFEKYCRQFRCRLTCLPLWGMEITRLAAEQNFKRRGEWLVAQFKNYSIILTNPDIFNLVMNYRYRTFIHDAVELPYSLGVGYDYFVFDEFHLFEMPQIVSALTAMLWLVEHNPSRPPRFIFSSATPEPELLDMVGRAGLRYTVIEGNYDTKASPGYRQVLHRAELYLHQMGDHESVEDWLAVNLDQLVELWRSASRRRPKGAVIVNSVATARRVAAFLREKLAPYEITVGENTGLTDLERRRLAMGCDLIVGTSTIDVGVDFDISLLIFESTGAGNFLQRLGRLGRVRPGETPFDVYRAYALFSGRTPWIFEGVVDGLKQKGIGEGDSVDRQTLAEIVRQTFPRREKFQSYARRWGVLQGAHVLEVLRDRRKGGAYESLAQALEERYSRLFDIPGFQGAKNRYWAIRKMENGGPILDEVLSFRGASPFQVGVWDATVTPPAFLSYDLLFLVQATRFEIASKDEMEQALQQSAGENWKLHLEEFKYVISRKSGEPLYLKILEFHPDRETLVLGLNENLAECSELLEVACVLSGFRIVEPRSCQALPEVNEVLKRQKVVCCISKYDRRDLWQRLRLPPFFPLYSLRDQRGKEFSVAFGKAALMLEPLLWRLRNRDENEAPIIL